MTHFAAHEQAGLKGTVTITNFVLSCKEAIDIDKMLSRGGFDSKTYRAAIARLKDLCQTEQTVVQNAVVQSGREVIARLLYGDTTYSGEINYGALGDSSTAVSDGQTTLVNEVFRKGLADRTRTNDSVTLDFYYSKSDTNGTYEEFALFIDGTATTDSGQMYNRLLTGGWSKSSSEAMTVSIQIDVNQAS